MFRGFLRCPVLSRDDGTSGSRRGRRDRNRPLFADAVDGVESSIVFGRFSTMSRSVVSWKITWWHARPRHSAARHAASNSSNRPVPKLSRRVDRVRFFDEGGLICVQDARPRRAAAMRAGRQPQDRVRIAPRASERRRPPAARCIRGGGA